MTALAATIFVANQTLKQPAKYEADALLAVGNLSSGKALGLSTGEDKMASVYAELLGIEEVYQRSAEESSTSATADQLKGHVSASTAVNSPYIKLTASDTDATAAVEEVNAVATGLVAYVTALQDINLQNGRQAIQHQLTQVENEINTIRASNAPEQGRLNALTAVRDSLLKQNEQNMTDTTYSRLSVVSLANEAVMQPPQKVRNILLGLLVGVIAGLALGFIYDSVVKAFNREKEIDPPAHVSESNK